MSKRPKALYMSYSGRQIGKVAEMFRAMVQKLGPKFDIKVSTPDIEKLSVFDEAAFRREWSIRGVGMAMPQDAMQVARCYHQWLVAPLAHEALPKRGVE